MIQTTESEDQPVQSDLITHLLQSQENLTRDIRELRDAQKEDFKYLTEKIESQTETIREHIDKAATDMNTKIEKNDKRLTVLEMWRNRIIGGVIVLGLLGSVITAVFKLLL